MDAASTMSFAEIRCISHMKCVPLKMIEEADLQSSADSTDDSGDLDNPAEYITMRTSEGSAEIDCAASGAQERFDTNTLIPDTASPDRSDSSPEPVPETLDTTVNLLALQETHPGRVPVGIFQEPGAENEPQDAIVLGDVTQNEQGNRDSINPSTVEDSIAKIMRRGFKNLHSLQDSAAVENAQQDSVSEHADVYEHVFASESVLEGAQKSVLEETKQDFFTIVVQHDCTGVEAPGRSAGLDPPQLDTDTMDSRKESFAEGESPFASAAETSQDTAAASVDYVAMDGFYDSTAIDETQGLSTAEEKNISVIKRPSSLLMPQEPIVSGILKGLSAMDTPNYSLVPNETTSVQKTAQIKEASSGWSELSPFAEPFTPRFGPFQAMTSDTQKQSDPTPSKSHHVQQHNCHQLHRDFRTTSEGSQNQIEGHCFSLFEAPYQQIFSSGCFEEASSLEGSRLKEVIKQQTPSEPLFNAPPHYFNMLLGDLENESKTDFQPIGYERMQTDCRASTSSDTCPGSATMEESSVGDLIYQLFPKDFCANPGGLMTNQTEQKSVDPPVVISENGTESITRFPFMHLDRKNEDGIKVLKRSASFIAPQAILDNCVRYEGLHRTMSSPELHNGSIGHTTLSSKTSTHGTHAEGTEADQTDADMADGDKTLLAEASPERQGDSLAGIPSDPHILGFSSRTSSQEELTIKTVEANNRNRYSSARLSADSGFGSLSNFSSMFAKAGSDSDGSPKSSPTFPRLCSQHNLEVTLYCTKTCEMMCHLCRSDHAQCDRVMTISSACRDVKNRLLTVQSHIDRYILALNKQASKLKPEFDQLSKRRQEAEKRAKDELTIFIKNIFDSHERQMKMMDEEFSMTERETSQKINTVEQTLALLNYVNKFVEVLRRRDSGWDLLSTFDRRLDLLLEKVVDTARTNREFVTLLEEEGQILDDCRETAYNSIQQFIDYDWTDEPDGQSCQKRRYAQDADYVDGAEDWSSKYLEQLSYGSDQEVDSQTAIEMMPSRPYNTRPEKNIKELMQEFRDYLQTCASDVDLSELSKSTSSLYSVVENLSLHSPTEGYDEVFLYETEPHGKNPPSDVFARKVTESGPEYKLKHRLSVQFPSDKNPAFVTDLHITESGLLVFLDAANNCLKRYDLLQVHSNPVSLQISQPLCLCSAGWDRVMVSGAGRVLRVYNVCRQRVQLVVHRDTLHQYRGLVRANDALVAATCPEEHTVDLLDLGGHPIRTLAPVAFVRGPEVVGVTQNWELLVVHQPVRPPTTLVCFDMAGKVLWSRALHSAARHVSCCKVVGGADGYVYVALQGDSVLYRIHPATGVTETVLNSRSGIKLPSSVAVTESGTVIVPRNELPNVQSGDEKAATSQAPHMLPTTTEIDIYVQCKDSGKNSGN